MHFFPALWVFAPVFLGSSEEALDENWMDLKGPMSSRWLSFLTNPSCTFTAATWSPLRWSDRVSCECDASWRTGREDVLHSGVRGEHLAHELLLLFPEVVLQVVGQHHVAGLLHGHHLAEHLQLWPQHVGEQRSVSGGVSRRFLLFLCPAKGKKRQRCSIFSPAPSRASSVSVMQSTGRI